MTRTTMRYSDYETIDFRDTSSNFPKRRRGLAIGTCLAVAGNDKQWKIYSIVTGKSILSIWFETIDDAVKLAEWLDGKYSEYFPIWAEYPDVDLFGLVKWSVKDGILIFEALRTINKKRRADWQDFADALREAKRHVRRWTRIRRDS